MWSGVDGKFQPYLGLGNNSSRTFHEHPEEVGECKVVQQRHEDDAARQATAGTAGELQEEMRWKKQME